MRSCSNPLVAIPVKKNVVALPYVYSTLEYYFHIAHVSRLSESSSEGVSLKSVDTLRNDGVDRFWLRFCLLNAIIPVEGTDIGVKKPWYYHKILDLIMLGRYGVAGAVLQS